jgi:bacillithiol biosynthesis cysteine-adding enzyme BshC
MSHSSVESTETAGSTELADGAIPLGELPHTSKLLKDYIEHFDRVAPFYSPVWTDSQPLIESVAKIAAQDYRRDELVDALIDQNKRYGSGSLTFEYLEELRSADSVAIVSGQQAGLFTGPLYTIMKALSVAKLTVELREQGIKVVPVFWVASEDHDFAEVNHCRIVDQEGKLIKISLDDCPAPQAQPVGHIHLCTEITGHVDQFLQALPDTESTKQISEMIHRAYAPGAGFAEAFSRVMAGLLGPYGIILLDPLDPRLKELSAELYEQALAKSSDIVKAVIDQTEELKEAGYHAQVYVEPDAVPLFAIHKGRREALVRNGSSLFLKHGKKPLGTVEELTERALNEPSAFSPNVTLRPVVQDTLLPTLAYIAGPSELAYFAQIKPIYEILGRVEPRIIPRSGGTLIDHATSKTLRKYNLSLNDFFEPTEVLFRKIVEEFTDRGTAATFDEVTATISAELNKLKEALNNVDPTIAAALDTRRKKIEHHLSNLRGKYVRSRIQQDQLAATKILAAQSILYPNKNLQEREINVFYFIAHHGFEVLDKIYQSLAVGSGTHQLIHLDS